MLSCKVVSSREYIYGAHAPAPEDVAASLPFGRFPVRNGGLESRLRLALEPAALSAGRGPGGGGCAVAESRREVVSGAREPGALEEMDERG